MLKLNPYLNFAGNCEEAMNFYKNALASDVPSFAPVTFNQGNNVSLSLSPDSLEEAERLFKALSEGGNVFAPFAKQFFGYHGGFTDKFGVNWMVTFETK